MREIIFLLLVVLLTYSSCLQESSKKINLVCDGNSLTYGTGSTKGNSYPELLSESMGIPIRNIAIAGQTTQQMISDEKIELSAIFDSSSLNVLIVWEARNDLVVNEVSSEEAFNNLATYCNIARANGWYVIVLTILPSWDIPPYKGDNSVNGYKNLDIDRRKVNQLIRSEWRNFADNLVDIANNDLIGSLGANENKGYIWSELIRPTPNTYFYDGTHMTDQGYLLVSKAIKKAIPM